jgi:hypothetical protein
MRRVLALALARPYQKRGVGFMFRTVRCVIAVKVASQRAVYMCKSAQLFLRKWCIPFKSRVMNKNISGIYTLPLIRGFSNRVPKFDW